MLTTRLRPLAFELIYYCAPNLHEKRLRWLAPGAVIGQREHEAINHCIGRASLAIDHCPPVQNVTSLVEGAFR